MEVEFKKERNGRQAVFLQVFHEKIMDFREYPYQISLNAKIERKAKKRKEAKYIFYNLHKKNGILWWLT